MTRIVLMGGEPELVNGLREILAAAGYPTEHSGSGFDAIVRVRRDPPDVLVLDAADLSEWELLELCRNLKAQEATAAGPLLVVTARSDFQSKAQALAAGADEYVTRPLDPADLLTRIRGLLLLSRARQELARIQAYAYGLRVRRGPPGPAAPGHDPPARGREDGEAAPHILLVDPIRFDREVHRSLLEGAGYRVTAAAAIVEALRPAGRDIDVILFNFRMLPETPDLQALERVQRLAPDVPMVIVSAYRDLPAALNALPVEAFNIITDQSKHEMLLRGVAGAVERRRLLLKNRRLLEALRGRLNGDPAERKLPAGYAAAPGPSLPRPPAGAGAGRDRDASEGRRHPEARE